MKFKLSVVLSLLLFLLVAFLSLNIGSYQISLQEIIRLLFGGTVSKKAYLIFFSFRLPRLVLAALVGGSLSLAGYIVQTLSRNPIADVGLLGINSGAAFGSVLYFFLVGAYFSEFSQRQYFSLVVFGLIGAGLAILFNLLLSFRERKVQMTYFILNGLGINLGFSAVTTYFSLKINHDDYERVNRWLEGSIASASWETTKKILPVIFICLFFLLLTSKKLSILRFSESHLLNIGFPIDRWRIIFLSVAAILVSATVSIAGSVAFVSLLVPHFTLLYCTRRSNWLTPLIFINGMTFMIIADSLAKNLFAPNEIPLNAVIGVIGIPYLIVLYKKSRSQKNAEKK